LSCLMLGFKPTSHCLGPELKPTSPYLDFWVILSFENTPRRREEIEICNTTLPGERPGIPLV
jgi:hypothetical protein